MKIDTQGPATQRKSAACGPQGVGDEGLVCGLWKEKKSTRKKSCVRWEKNRGLWRGRRNNVLEPNSPDKIRVTQREGLQLVKELEK